MRLAAAAWHVYLVWCGNQACRSGCSLDLLLPHLLCAGIVYGLYLTLSTWILYYVATKMNFFEQSCHLPSLNNEVRPPLHTRNPDSLKNSKARACVCCTSRSWQEIDEWRHGNRLLLQYSPWNTPLLHPPQLHPCFWLPF